MTILDRVEELRNKYWLDSGRTPTKLYINPFILRQLEKQLLYTGWGYHRIVNNTILGMNIISKCGFNQTWVGE